MLIAAERLAAEVGAKVTDRVQLAPAARVVLQPLVRLKLAGLVPMSVMLVMLRVAPSWIRESHGLSCAGRAVT